MAKKKKAFGKGRTSDPALNGNKSDKGKNAKFAGNVYTGKGNKK